MNNWSNEKNKEYKSLKRKGLSKSELKEHFGDDIYDSPYFNKNGSILKFNDYKRILENINEIRINPEKAYYIVFLFNLKEKKPPNLENF